MGLFSHRSHRSHSQPNIQTAAPEVTGVDGVRSWETFAANADGAKGLLENRVGAIDNKFFKGKDVEKIGGVAVASEQAQNHEPSSDTSEHSPAA